MQFIGDGSIPQRIERLTELDVAAHPTKRVLRKPPGALMAALVFFLGRCVASRGGRGEARRFMPALQAR
jgi:hypothetical protein